MDILVFSPYHMLSRKTFLRLAKAKYSEDSQDGSGDRASITMGGDTIQPEMIKVLVDEQGNHRVNVAPKVEDAQIKE